MLKVIFLDIDGTLLSFDECVKEAMRSGFKKYGLREYTDDMFPVFHRINTGLWREIEQNRITFDELLQTRWRRIFEALEIEFDGAVFEEYFRKRLFSSAIPEPHATELLAYLSKKYTLCAASNGPFAQQVNRLAIGGMKEYFDYIFISEKAGASKPSGEFFDYCFRELRASSLPDLRPEEAMMIGDSLSSDIAGGCQYGMKTCLYRRDGGAGPLDPSPDHLVTSLAEIPAFL